MGHFGERLKIAFQNARNAEIARKLRVSEPAVKNYVSGRLPNLDTLIEIKNLTGFSLDWLITGEEETQREAVNLSGPIVGHLRTIAREQANRAFADVDIASGNLEDRTLDLLVEYLIATALVEYKLIDSPARVMQPEDLRRAQRFDLQRMTIEERLRQLVREEAAIRDGDIGGEVSGIEPAEQITVRHLGVVSGGEEEEERLRKTG